MLGAETIFLHAHDVHQIGRKELPDGKMIGRAAPLGVRCGAATVRRAPVSPSSIGDSGRQREGSRIIAPNRRSRGRNRRPRRAAIRDRAYAY